MTNWLQTNLTKSKRKVKLKSTTEIDNDFQAQLKFLLSKMDGPTLRQVPSTTLIQQVL